VKVKEIDSVSSASDSTHTSLDGLTASELTDSLYAKLKVVNPLNTNRKAPTMGDVRALLTDFKNVPMADESWLNSAPKNAVSRYVAI
jgi:hypothetical protein